MDFSPERQPHGSGQEELPTPQATEKEWGFFLLQDLERTLAEGDQQKIEFSRNTLKTFIEKLSEKNLRAALVNRLGEIESEGETRQAA